MDKSADAFRTISEVAQDRDLPQLVLRFWESKFPQIRPLKRAGGRRYYRPADVLLLRSIRRLLYDEGYTIKGVQRLLKDRGARNLDAAPSSDIDDADFGPEPGMGGRSAEEALSEDISAIEAALPYSSTNDATRVLPSDAAALQTCLTCIEECERILAAVRAPTP